MDINDFFKNSGYKERKKQVRQLIRRKNKIKSRVRALSYHPIPICFPTSDDKKEVTGSYTSGNGILISANLDCENDDHITGHALHQAAHILETDFEFLSDFRDFPKYYVPSHIWDKAKDYKREDEMIHFIILLIGNIIENKRLDTWVYNSVPGYRKYIDAMYDEMYHSEEVFNAFDNHRYAHQEDIPTYLFYTMHVGNRRVDTDDLYALDKIYDLIDIENVSRFDSRQEIHHLACRVFEIILRHVDGLECQNLEKFRSLLRNCMNGLMDDTVDFLMGEVQPEMLSHQLQDEINVFESSNTEDIQFKPEGFESETRCIVVNKMTPDMLENKSVGNLSDSPIPNSLQAVEEGEFLGQQLQEKIKLRDDEHVEKRTRKRSGEIDPANLAEIGYNNDIFMERDVDRYDKLNIHISIDASGSMCGDKWLNTMKSAVALAKAVDGLDSINIQISFRTTSYPGARDMKGVSAVVLMAYDSRYEPFEKVRYFFPHVGPSGSTPEGLCYEATMRHMLETVEPGVENYFVNYSDGMPQTSMNGESYSGNKAITHTAKQVQKMKDNGISVLSYYITNCRYNGAMKGNASSAFQRMYGENAQFINPTDVISVAKTLNDKFLEKSNE